MADEKKPKRAPRAPRANAARAVRDVRAVRHAALPMAAIRSIKLKPKNGPR